MKLNQLSFNTINLKQNVYKKKTTNQTKPIYNHSNSFELRSYPCDISFARSWKEHKSWGAVVNPDTKDVSFKISTYPDTRFVDVVIENENGEVKHKQRLQNKGDGVFETKDPIDSSQASVGDSYYYLLTHKDGTTTQVKDPYSYRQKQLKDKSVIYDQSAYVWNDSKWKNSPNRISRKHDGSTPLTPNSARIYELNTASFTKDGDFDGIKKHISKLSSMGFNTIEIMPVENTYSFNWGYDGVDKFAPSEHLGGPDKLKELIDYAHQNGLNVVMDMVPNHLGPDGAQLRLTGPYIKGNNAFGEAFNYEGKNSKYTRDYIVNSALNWIDNYHCDGLRLDMTKFMESDTTMKQIAAELNYHRPDAFLIAEDARDCVSVYGDEIHYNDYNYLHDERVINPLKDYEYGEYQDESAHNEAINNIQSGKTSLARLGYDSEWDFKFYHTLKSMLYNDSSTNVYEFDRVINDAQTRVKYVMSHDEIGNFDGTRLVPKLLVPALNLNDNIILSEQDKQRAKEFSKLKNVDYNSALNSVKCQKAQLTAEKLATLFACGKLDKYRKHDDFIKQVLIPNDINPDSQISYGKLYRAFNNALASDRMASAIIYSIPGPKMVFQGDERADLTPFRFFREFDFDKQETYLPIEKGYKNGKDALVASTLGLIKYSDTAKTKMSQYEQLITDLNILNIENQSLQNGYISISSTILHPKSNLIGYLTKSKDKKNQIFTVANFSDKQYPRKDVDKYFIDFPDGKWVEILNTDDKKYGGKNLTNSDSGIINGYSNSQTGIKISGESVAMFKRIDLLNFA